MMLLEREFVEELSAEVADFSADMQQWGRVSGYSAGVLQATGFDVPLGCGAEVRAEDGTVIGAEVIGFDGSTTFLAPYDLKAPIRIGALIRPVTTADMVPAGPPLLGRIIDPLGQALDGKGAVTSSHGWPLRGKSENILNRGRVTEALDVGVRALNGLLPVGAGQRVVLIAGSGVGKTVLMRQLTTGAQADVIIVGLIGERAREVSDFIAATTEAGMAEKMTVVAVPADHSPILRIKAAQRAAALAEYHRAEGRRVLLVLDSLTRIAHAQREIGLAGGEPPTMKGYPPSAIALIPQLLERAGRDARSGGSITAFYTVLADGDDFDDPVVDAARAIADGHIVLSRELAEQGVYPAIDVAKSVSRVAQDIIDADHAEALQHFRSLWSSFEENRDLITMGAYREGSDPHIDMAIARRADLTAYVGQNAADRIDRESAIGLLVQEFTP